MSLLFDLFDINDDDGRPWSAKFEQLWRVANNDDGTSKGPGGRPLLPFWSALANRNSGPCDILAVGTSITHGDVVNPTTDCWLDVFRDRLRLQFPAAGVTGGFGYIQANPSSLVTQFAVLSGSAIGYGIPGLGKGAVRLNASGAITFATIACTDFDIIWEGASGNGSFSYTVDGGAPTTVSTNQATTDAYRTSVTGLSVASHIIVLAWVSGTVYIDGVMIYDGDAANGVRVWNGGMASATSATFASGTNNIEWLRCVHLVQPALVIIELGINDPILGVSVANMKTNLGVIVANVKARCTIPPAVILVADWSRHDDTTSVWVTYNDAIKAVVQADPTLLLFNMALRTYQTAAESAADVYGILADGVHPNVKGSQMWADALVAAVSP